MKGHITEKEVRDCVMNKHDELVASAQYCGYFDHMLSSIRSFFGDLQRIGRLGFCDINVPTTMQDIRAKKVKYRIWWVDDDGKIPHGGGECDIEIGIDDVMSQELIYYAG